MLQLNDTIILIQNIGPLNVGAICKILAFADGDSYSTAKMVLLAVPKNQGVSWDSNNSLKINNDYVSRTRFACASIKLQFNSFLIRTSRLQYNYKNL